MAKQTAEIFNFSWNGLDFSNTTKQDNVTFLDRALIMEESDLEKLFLDSYNRESWERETVNDLKIHNVQLEQMAIILLKRWEDSGVNLDKMNEHHPIFKIITDEVLWNNEELIEQIQWQLESEITTLNDRTSANVNTLLKLG